MLGEGILEGGGDGDAVEYGIDGDACKALLLFQGDAQLVEGAEKLFIDLVEALQEFLRLRGRVVVHVLEVYFRVVDVGPAGDLLLVGLGAPVAVGFEAPFQHPVGFFLLGGNPADDVLVETTGSGFGLDVGDETILIVLVGDFPQGGVSRGHPSLLMVC